MEFTKYITATEDIVTVGGCPDEMIGYQTKVGESILIGYYPPDRYYIDNRLPRTKVAYTLSISKTTIIADGVDQSIISNIPSNTIVTINEVPYTVNDGVIEIISNEVATITITFDNRYYLNTTVTINAT